METEPEHEGTPPQVTMPGPIAKPARNLWIVAVIVALIAGVVGGYFLRRGTEPTKTVTTRVTRTVPQESYTTSSNVSTQAFFDGKSCLYNGPGELKAGTTVSFMYTARDVSAQPSTLTLWQTDPGTTYEQVRQYFGPNGYQPANVMPLIGTGQAAFSEPMGTAHQTFGRRVTEGVWAITCNTSPESTNTAYFGALLRVLP